MPKPLEEVELTIPSPSSSFGEPLGGSSYRVSVQEDNINKETFPLFSSVSFIRLAGIFHCSSCYEGYEMYLLLINIFFGLWHFLYC